MHTEDKAGKRVMRRVLQSDPDYAAMIWNLDWNIGRLLRALEESGQAENTVVIFTSDNGGLSTSEGSPTCNLPAREGKGWVEEGGIRVPLLVRFPGRIKPGTRCDVPVTTPDFYPTFLEFAGLPEKKEQHRDGRSIVPLLRGEAMPEHPLFWHYPHYGNQGGVPGSAIRLGRYKLIESLEDQSLRLYDLETDFGETRNLAGENPELAAKLLLMLHGWQKDVQAMFPTPNPDWKGQAQD